MNKMFLQHEYRFLFRQKTNQWHSRAFFPMLLVFTWLKSLNLLHWNKSNQIQIFRNCFTNSLEPLFPYYCKKEKKTRIHSSFRLTNFTAFANLLWTDNNGVCIDRFYQNLSDNNSKMSQLTMNDNWSSLVRYNHFENKQIAHMFSIESYFCVFFLLSAFRYSFFFRCVNSSRFHCVKNWCL